MMDEEWRDVPGWEGLYQVSSLGRARRITHFRKVAERLFEPDQFNLIAAYTDRRTGYLTVRLSNGKSKTLLLHRLICEAFHGSPPEADSQVAHFDGTRNNNLPTNLRWASPLENSQDRRRHMRDALGSDHKLSKLTKADVLDIRLCYRKRYGALADLARTYNVTSSLIYNIVNRKTWKHI